MTSSLYDGRTFDVLAERLAVDCERRPVDEIGQPRQESAQPAGVVEVLHQVFAGRTHVGEHRCAAGEGVEARKVEMHAGAARHRDEMHHRVGRSAERERRRHRVVDRARIDHVANLQVLPDHLDDALAGHGRHLLVARVRCGDRRGTGQRETHGLGRAGHRRRSAHGHAMPGRARDAVFHAAPVFFRDVARAKLRPVLPSIAAAAQVLAAEVAAQHRARRNVDRRQVHRQRTHHERGCGLVATAHQHGAVGRIAAQELFGLHREQVAIEHRRRLLERLGKRDRGHLDGEPARLPDAALDFLGALPEVAVARVDVAPRVDDRDHRLADVIRARVAHLRRARTVPERTQVVDAVPAMAAQLFRLLALLAHD
jgi:hypothetical protein